MTYEDISLYDIIRILLFKLYNNKNFLRVIILNNIYLTVLSSSNYLNGVLVLHESLKKVKAKYPLYVLLSDNIDYSVELYLKKRKIFTIRRDNKLDISKKISDINKKQGSNRWSNTFYKLYIFGLIEFKKIVYLDCDMLVLSNIDELMEKPHMSAVQAGRSKKGHEHWVKLNSGLMVIEPEKKLCEELIILAQKMINETNYSIGDQDVLHKYYISWEKNSLLILDETYNVFINHIDYYKNILKYKDIKVMHFIGEDKPWLLNTRGRIFKYLKLLIKMHFWEIYYLNSYFKYLNSI